MKDERTRFLKDKNENEVTS